MRSRNTAAGFHESVPVFLRVQVHKKAAITISDPRPLERVCQVKKMSIIMLKNAKLSTE